MTYIYTNIMDDVDEPTKMLVGNRFSIGWSSDVSVNRRTKLIDDRCRFTRQAI